jgi:hypothetical protein
VNAMTHKFRVGQTVQFQHAARFLNTASGLYNVTKLLPERDGEFEYRIKSQNEPHERTAKESELIDPS